MTRKRKRGGGRNNYKCPDCGYVSSLYNIFDHLHQFGHYKSQHYFLDNDNYEGRRKWKWKKEGQLSVLQNRLKTSEARSPSDPMFFKIRENDKRSESSNNSEVEDTKAKNVNKRAIHEIEEEKKAQVSFIVLLILVSKE